jgi:hypothetical protein
MCVRVCQSSLRDLRLRLFVSRHFAALRAGLMTIAPPALGRPRSREWLPDATYRPQVTQSLCAYVNRPSGTCDSARSFPGTSLRYVPG